MKFEDYVKLSELLKEARVILFSHKIAPRTKTKPLARYRQAAIKALDSARHHADEMLFLEHPRVAAGDIFYFNEPPPDVIEARRQLADSNQEGHDP